ncbi:MAG: hypothetical protein ABL921_31380, partial [Pirellula sp.]
MNSAARDTTNHTQADPNELPSNSSIKRQRVFACALLLLFLCDVFKHAAIFATGPTILEYDARDYWERGERVANGDILQTQGAVNYRGPVYPW